MNFPLDVRNQTILRPCYIGALAISNSAMESVMYRILTERKNAEQVKAALGGFGLDYTVFDAEGSWNGQAENSMAIELDGVSWETITVVARLIKTINDQDAILIQRFPTTSHLI